MTVITLTTDFGLADGFVGVMKGVLASRAPGANVIDLTHDVPPQNVIAGALVLRSAVPYFPAGSIHVAVVDPGVGSARRALCVETARGLFVGPDNGLLTLAADVVGIRRVIHVTNERHFLAPRSATFHGRDVFAPVAAALATGADPGALGPAIEDPVRLAVPAVERTSAGLLGQVLYVDHFGNLITNLGVECLADPARAALSIRGARIESVAPTYSAVEPGRLVAVIGSWGLLEIAVRDGSAARVLGAAAGTGVTVHPG